MRPHLPPNVPDAPAIDATGAVDLNRLPCTGCRHASLGPQPSCRRFPPVFMPAQPQLDAQGQPVGMTMPGWAFPPAAMKCGEFARVPAEALTTP